MKPSTSPQMFYFNPPASNLDMARTASTASSAHPSTDTDDEFYFSDESRRSTRSAKSTKRPSYKQASSSTSTSTSSYTLDSKCSESCKCTKCTLGDFVFDSVEEYNDYLSLITDYQMAHPEQDMRRINTPMSSPELEREDQERQQAHHGHSHSHSHDHSHSHSHAHSHHSTLASSSSSSSVVATKRRPSFITLPSRKFTITTLEPRPRPTSLRSHWSDDSDLESEDEQDEDEVEYETAYTSASPSLSEDVDGYTNERWERALVFANWTSTSGTGRRWVAPSTGKSASRTVKRLVRSVQ